MLVLSRCPFFICRSSAKARVVGLVWVGVRGVAAAKKVVKGNYMQLYWDGAIDTSTSFSVVQKYIFASLLLYD